MYVYGKCDSQSRERKVNIDRTTNDKNTRISHQIFSALDVVNAQRYKGEYECNDDNMRNIKQKDPRTI